MRRAAIAIMTAGLMLGFLGCSSPFMDVCPAIAWSSGVTIDTSAYGPEIFVQVCTEAGCSASPGEHPTPSSDFSVPEGDGTVFWFGMSAPDVITVRVYDSTGGFLSEAQHSIDWTHSTERCGGPSTAPPLVLEP